MKPFNLERAIAGDPVQTKNGKPVKQLSKFESIVKYNVIGVVDGVICHWDEWGNSFLLNEPENYQLVMAPVKKTGWLNLYEWEDGQRAGIVYNSEEEAIEETKIFYKYKTFIKTIKIEWED